MTSLLEIVAYAEIVDVVLARCGVSSDGAFGMGIPSWWRWCQRTYNGKWTSSVSDAVAASKVRNTISMLFGISEHSSDDIPAP